jgi:glycosyltransferase involved in cell wall biosynthesis
MRFSIVIPSFNQGPFLEECLELLIRQAGDDTELIVVDGGSRDESAPLIRRHARHLAWWCSEPDQGQSDALIKGFARAKGEWLGWINSDDLLLDGALETVRTFLDAHPQAEWVVGGGRMIDAAGRLVRAYTAPTRPLRATDLAPWTDTWFGQPGCFFRRDLYERAGGTIATRLHYAMDLDLWLRLGRLAPLLPIPTELGAYRLHDESKTVAQRAPMETEVVQVLLEHLGPGAALERVRLLAEDKFAVEARYRRLTQDLISPAGWTRLLQRRLKSLMPPRDQPR